MKIFLVQRTDDIGYDEYDSVVAVAASEKQARETHPVGHEVWCSEDLVWYTMFDDGTLSTEASSYHGWTTDIASLKVELLGNYLGPVGSERPGPIMASFNAG